MGNVFRYSAICNIQQAEEKIRSNLETTWKNYLQHVPKLRTYSLLKSNYYQLNSLLPAVLAFLCLILLPSLHIQVCILPI